MPVRICDRLNVIAVKCAVTCYAADVPIFPRKLVKSSLDGGVYARSETADHTSPSRDFYAPLESLVPGMGGWGDYESLFAYLGGEKMIPEEYPVGHLPSIQRAFEEGDMGNASWLLGTEHPADGLTKVRSGMVHLLRLLGSGRFNPGSWMPLREVAWREAAARA